MFMARILLYFFLFLVGGGFAFAQQAELTGKVTDESGEPLPFATVAITVNGILQGATTDFDGVYSVKPIPAGTYNVEVTFVGYQGKKIEGVQVSTDQITFLDVVLAEESEILEAFEVVSYEVPLIEQDKTSTGSTVTQKDIANLPTRNVNSIASNTAGVFQSDEGGGLNVKGSRQDATDFYIDGIKVRGSANLPPGAIEQLTVITGGTPARYGDATGGIINITTRGPSNAWHGGVEMITSRFLDPYNYNIANFNLSGPLLRTNKGTDQERALLGIFLSGEYAREDDDDPSALGVWRVNDDKLNDIRENPLILSGSGIQKQVDFVTNDDMERVDIRPNLVKDRISATAKLDFQPVQNINFTLGGTFNWENGGSNFWNNNFLRRFELYNPQHMPDRTGYVYRAFGRLTQRFGNNQGGNDAGAEDGSQRSSAISNAYYQLQFDYTRTYNRTQDPMFEDRFFEYGYAGQFTTFREPTFSQNTVELNGVSVTGWEFQGFTDTLVTYQPGGVNPDKDNHNMQYFDLAGDDRERFYTNLDQIFLNNGLLNGVNPISLTTAYNLYYTPGTSFTQYTLDEDDQYRLVFNGSFDIKGANSSNRHAIEFGFEYEQRIDRNWSVFPVGLWNVAFDRIGRFGRDFVRDLDNPILLIDGQEIPMSEYDGVNQVFNPFTDTITYDIVRVEQSYFDQQFREKFNLSPFEIVNIDEYAPSDFSLDMFSADELLNGGNEFVRYSGYDYTGNRLTNEPAFEDFWTATDENGNFTRPIGSFRPIYMAGYLQDKFSFRDLVFRVGVRVDRFDANQQVPIDIYSPIYGYRTAEEVTEFGEHPETIGDDFAVYVDDEFNPTQILGYRKGDQWYNANGLQEPNADLIASGSTVRPYRVDDADVKSEAYDPSTAFEDYDPQINVMPRVAFSFNISGDATFFANYDVLTQRPQARLQTTPYNYYFFSELAVNRQFNNPTLRPEKTINYQVGFKQKISKNAAITMSAFYRELRDMIQVVTVFDAYPNQYSTYRNFDVATVKGFELGYDMRRVNNLKLRIDYTLQFAEGTGSGDRSQANLAAFGLPNLRNIVPLSYDARHMIVVQADYRYGDGKNYNGPKLFGKDILSNTGLNLNIRARSGTPFTRQAQPTPDAQFGVRTQSALDGTINGSRLPFNFNINARLDKTFILKSGREEGKADKDINVYLWVQNLLDTRNVISVYGFTGTPDDDGFITSGPGIETVEAQVSERGFLDQYTIKVQNPNNFSLPRRIRLGVIFGF